MDKKYIIHVPSSKRSLDSAIRSIKIAKQVGKIEVELWDGVDKRNSWIIMENKQMKMRSVNDSYIGSGYMDCEIGAFLSHMSLWEKCIELDERILIMEHDATFQNEFTHEYYDGILNFGIPNWGSRVWDDVKESGVVEREDCDKFHDPHDVYNPNNCRCDTKWLFGAHTYSITPRVAKILIDDARTNGIYALDRFIRTDLVNIADYLPLITRQDSDFTLIQKKHRTKLISANEAWK